jgi:hypothetical protein
VVDDVHVDHVDRLAEQSDETFVCVTGNAIENPDARAARPLHPN